MNNLNPLSSSSIVIEWAYWSNIYLKSDTTKCLFKWLQTVTWYNTFFLKIGIWRFQKRNCKMWAFSYHTTLYISRLFMNSHRLYIGSPVTHLQKISNGWWGRIPSAIIHMKSWHTKNERKNPNIYNRKEKTTHMTERKRPNIYVICVQRE
jgi:TM2 domain-containing membrane protein YozV